jgi:hypothetical protein
MPSTGYTCDCVIVLSFSSFLMDSINSAELLTIQYSTSTIRLSIGSSNTGLTSTQNRTTMRLTLSVILTLEVDKTSTLSRLTIFNIGYA